MKEPYVFKDLKELREFLRGSKTFTEPKRLEVVDEVPSKPANKRKSKANAKKVGKSAENKD